MKVLNTAHGGKLRSSDLNDQAKALLSLSLALGKGVVDGMEVSPGPGLGLTVSPGQFRAQVPDELQEPTFVPVPPDYKGFLWVEANSDPEDVPNFDYQATKKDYGSDWVCLGRFISDSDSVTFDHAGRKAFGWKALAASTLTP